MSEGTSKWSYPNIQEIKIMESGPITSWQINGETIETVTDFILGGSKITRQWLPPWNQKTLDPWKKSYDKPRQHLKKQRHHVAETGPYSQSYGFSSSHVHMWKLDHKEDLKMAGWHHWLNEHESEQIPGDSEGQGSLACCSPWDCKELDMTEQLKNNKMHLTIAKI